MENKVRTGIIGVGNMGYAHARALYNGEIDTMCLCALCDTDEERRKILEEDFPGIPVFESHEQLLSSGLCDAAVIATPHRFHSLIACDALDAGLHVLTEKPEDVSVSAAKRLNEKARESGLVFGIMFNQRTNPLFAKAREIVKSGALGTPKRLVWIITNWYRTQAYYDSGSWRATWRGEGGGVLLNQAPHNLDIWQWIFGMPEKLRAECKTAKYHNIEVEDEASIYAEYANGATAVFLTTTGEYPGTNRLEIAGDMGKIVLEEGKLKHWKLSVHERDYCFSASLTDKKPDVEYEEITAEEGEEAHCAILRNFSRAVLYGEELLAPGYDGINELSISNAAYLSSWTGETVTIPFDGEKFDALLEEKRRTGKDPADKKAKESTGGYKKRWQVNW